MNMPGITLTGVDDYTKVVDMVRLVRLGAEVGFLYTHSPDGRPRYPTKFWIETRVFSLAGAAAVHICGQRARVELLEGKLDMMLERVRRVQVNGAVNLNELSSVCRRYPDKTIITQHIDANTHLVHSRLANHAILVDASGGRGKLPEKWQRPDTPKRVGFAGGLGPETLRKELPKIAAIAGDDYWIDMEGRLRDGDDWFDVERALQVMNIWRSFQLLARSSQVESPAITEASR